MKKWLDDLYAILLKRGFKTLDNSLKNYKTIQDTPITNKVNVIYNSLNVANNDVIEIDLSELNLNNNFMYSVFIGTGTSCRLWMSLYYDGVNTYGMQTHLYGFSIVTTSNNVLVIKNVSGTNLTCTVEYKATV